MEPEAYQEMALLEGVHGWYAGMRAITSRLLAAYLGERTDLRILDAGCGTGANLAALAGYGRVVGFDYSPLALDYASHDHPGGVARASIVATPYADNTFDLVTSFDVIYAREVNDDQAAIRELARVLRPGGWLLVRVPALPILRGPHDTVVHGIRRYTAARLESMILAAGLIPVRLTYANSLLLPLALASRTAQNLAVMLGAKLASEVGGLQGAMSHIMRAALGAEARWIGGGRNLPVGVSLFALARKP